MINSKLSRLIPHTYLFLKKAVLLLTGVEDIQEPELLKEFVKKNFPYPNATTEKEAENLEKIFAEFFLRIYYNRKFDFDTDDAVFKEIDIYYFLFYFAKKHPEYLTLLVPEELKIKKENEKEEIEKGVKNIVEYLILLSRESKYPEDMFLFNLNLLENFFLILVFNYKYPIKPVTMLEMYFEKLFVSYVAVSSKRKISENTFFKEVLEKVNSIIIVSEINEELPGGFFPDRRYRVRRN